MRPESASVKHPKGVHVKHIKVSFVATVFNEEKTIGALLDSLFRQTKMPDEIIIIDGGSSDATASIISKRFHLPEGVTFKKIKFKIIVKPKSTIAQGRNYGIRKATGDVIAMSDAGCILHKDWLEKITKPLVDKNADIIAGFYKMTGSSSIQKALAVYLGIPPKRFDKDKFLPSARSIAFRKSLWEKIGGFNENLDRAGEDTLFNYQAIKLGAKFVRVKGALVDWKIPNSLWEGFKKFYIYAKGDVQAGIWWHPLQRISTHNLKIFSVYARYIAGLILLIASFQYESIGFVLVIAIVFYLVWSIWKIQDLVSDTRTRLWVPIVQIVSDSAVFTGAVLGFLSKIRKNDIIVRYDSLI